ncbi:hypothetical protein B1757_14810 [Acidithiobacillus marinus]|uniref:Uncharacterized protein n=1 Tax=Acidithiobacillus marinus TaxID=187490 RepID=A0A2I1DHV6_9PROT|nr:hypothetical protein B1757_14810 [Acidithiobacillus marinus]
MSVNAMISVSIATSFLTFSSSNNIFLMRFACVPRGVLASPGWLFLRHSDSGAAASISDAVGFLVCLRLGNRNVTACGQNRQP